CAAAALVRSRFLAKSCCAFGVRSLDSVLRDQLAFSPRSITTDRPSNRTRRDRISARAGSGDESVARAGSRDGGAAHTTARTPAPDSDTASAAGRAGAARVREEV